MTVLPKNVYSRNFQADHQTHILYLSVHGVVQCMKNAVSAQEEQGLEEGVREEVEHPGARTILGACDPQAEDQDHGDSEQRFVHVRDGDRQLAKVKGPVLLNRSIIPMRKPTSPTRVVMNASMAALAGERRSSSGLARLLIQKPISGENGPSNHKTVTIRRVMQCGSSSGGLPELRGAARVAIYAQTPGMASARAAGETTGRAMKKVEPSPSTDSHQIRPPCRSTRVRQR
jgi:hypothetical protein